MKTFFDILFFFRLEIAFGTVIVMLLWASLHCIVTWMDHCRWRKQARHEAGRMRTGKDVDIKLRFVLWSGARIQALLGEIQEEIQARVAKLLGPENKIEIICDVQRIEDHEAVPETRSSEKKLAAL